MRGDGPGGVGSPPGPPASPGARPGPVGVPGPSVGAMPNLEDLVSKIPIGQVADRLGVPPAIANSLVRTALPALVGGMQANAQDPAGEASLAGALGQHAGAGDLAQVDEADGQKIVGHLFGDNEGAVVSRLGDLSNMAGGEGLMAKLLPMLAPMVMSWVASDLLGGAGGAGGGDDSPLGDLLGGGGLGSLGSLGGSLGGGLGDLAKGAVAEDGADLAGALGLSDADTGGGLSGILGGLLQNELHGEGGLDELLGGLLGGGSR